MNHGTKWLKHGVSRREAGMCLQSFLTSSHRHETRSRPILSSYMEQLSTQKSCHLEDVPVTSLLLSCTSMGVRDDSLFHSEWLSIVPSKQLPQINFTKPTQSWGSGTEGSQVSLQLLWVDGSSPGPSTVGGCSWDLSQLLELCTHGPRSFAHTNLPRNWSQA